MVEVLPFDHILLQGGARVNGQPRTISIWKHYAVDSGIAGAHTSTAQLVDCHPSPPMDADAWITVASNPNVVHAGAATFRAPRKRSTAQQRMHAPRRPGPHQPTRRLTAPPPLLLPNVIAGIQEERQQFICGIGLAAPGPGLAPAAFRPQQVGPKVKSSWLG